MSCLRIWFAVALSAAVLAATSATAKEPVQRKAPPRGTAAEAAKLDAKTTGTNVRVSQLIGKNIQNPAGDGVGEIKDIVIDANTGRVRYAAVTYGGFLGLGNKMFAVPFAAFKCRPDPDDKDEHILVLDVTEKKLKGATGFDEDHWPNFADRSFTSELDKLYGVERRRPLRNGKVDVRVGPGGVDVDVEGKKARD